MLDISIRQLESFAATAEYSSFTRAAQELHLTQSTVSMHIQSLEDILGTQLIVRGARKRFSLTEDGKRVYAAAKDILSRCEALQQMRQGLESEALSIGTSTVPAQHLLPSLMSAFMKKHPDVRYILRRGDSGQVHTLLERNEVRLGFVGEAADNRRFNYYPIARDNLVLITENSPRFQKLREQGVPGLELLSEPIIEREESSGTQHAVDNYLRSKGVSLGNLHLVARMDNPEAIKQSVSQGLGVAILSNLAVGEEVRSRRLLAFELDEEGAYRHIYIAWRKDMSLTPLEQRFLSFIKNEAPKLARL